MEARVPAGLTIAEGRKFGVLVGSVFLLLSLVSKWRGHAVAPSVLAPLGLLLVIAGVLVPGRLGPVYRGWMGLATVISRVTTPLFMGAVYFLVLTPMALIRRFAAGNPMRHTATEHGYWVSRSAPPTADGMEHQF